VIVGRDDPHTVPREVKPLQGLERLVTVLVHQNARIAGLLPRVLDLQLMPGGRYDESVLARLEVIGLCKSAGFALDEIHVLFADDAPGRLASRTLAEAKLAEIDAQIESLTRARGVIAWGMRCTCPSIDSCTCGVHPPKPAA
jgi:hypothetical protein